VQKFFHIIKQINFKNNKKIYESQNIFTEIYNKISDDLTELQRCQIIQYKTDEAIN